MHHLLRKNVDIFIGIILLRILHIYLLMCRIKIGMFLVFNPMFNVFISNKNKKYRFRTLTALNGILFYFKSTIFFIFFMHISVNSSAYSFEKASLYIFSIAFFSSGITSDQPYFCVIFTPYP